jgi:uncharacterized membrane protein
MQNPPPGPPPGGQPPNYQPPGGQQPPPGYQPPYQPPQYQPQPGYQPTAGAGIDKRTGAFLAYVLQWLTGIIFLFVGKNDPDVKYHAAQSVVFFGGLTVIFFAADILYAFMPGIIKVLLALVLFAASIFWLVAWIMCLIRAWNGGGARFEVPLVGSFVTPYAEQLANAVN